MGDWRRREREGERGRRGGIEGQRRNGGVGNEKVGRGEKIC